MNILPTKTGKSAYNYKAKKGQQRFVAPKQFARKGGNGHPYPDSTAFMPGLCGIEESSEVIGGELAVKFNNEK
ncbi:hypothetical protein GRF59_06555 [Paenibacillus sp. HJL G12]|uniref:Uncharacterized protein n=1 Tax=Paenibacillus dendrobii TaxID=2691084 RepID=A0A7X3IG38_9BACL|nr:hypothetical protein [Paenibacillus dendrobii]MWV43289.1 hypothetical protein [Paenibacillus dendrobii]